MDLDKDKVQQFEYVISNNGKVIDEISLDFVWVDATPWYYRITNFLGLTSENHMRATYFDEEINKIINSCSK